MSSDAIWSNGPGAASPHHSTSSTYRSVLDQVDPEVAKMLANSASANALASSTHHLTGGESRRFSFNDGDNGLFGFRKESLSAVKPSVGYAASTGGVHHAAHAATGPMGHAGHTGHTGHTAPSGASANHLGFGTASISGGIASRHPPQDSFLQKFSSVADATRDIELSNNLGKLSLENGTSAVTHPASRRTSFNQSDIPLKPLSEVGGGLLSSPHGSLNENLNMPAPRTSRHQSISDKIDQYNNTSPIQTNTALSISSDLNSNLALASSASNSGTPAAAAAAAAAAAGGNGKGHDLANGSSHGNAGRQSFWSPATATSFTPSNSYNYFLENQGLSGMPAPPPQFHPGQVFNPYLPRNGPPHVAPLSPPPFMVPSPPPPQFMDPNFYNMMGYAPNINGPTENPTSSPPEKTFSNESLKDLAYTNHDPANAKSNLNNNHESYNNNESSVEREIESPKDLHRHSHTPGIGLMNRPMGPPVQFMFGGFHPYGLYPHSPSPNNTGLNGPNNSRSTPGGIPSPNPILGANPLGQPGSIDSNIPNGGIPGPIPGGIPAPFVDPIISPTGGPNRNNQPPLQHQSNGPKSRRERKGNGSAKNNTNNGSNNSSNNANHGNENGGGKGGNHIYRSPLLEEVRSNFKGKEYFLKDIYGHAVEFTKDQHGSRFIQQKLPDASEEEKEVIFNEIRDISYDLMTDVFGNYVIQKYFEHGSTTQQKILLEYMDGHIYELSLQMYGCRVIQRALEAIDLDAQIKIINELKDYVLICAKDQNGNHVIQKSIERIPFTKIRFIADSLDNQIYHLSTHPYGCRVIQRLLEHSGVEDQKKILDELNRFIFYLIQDQYGNYVMQHILERGNPEDREAVLVVVLGSVVNFSKHKFASNVIEKCIKYGTLDQRKRILHEVMLGNEDEKVELVNDDSALALMVKDQYANYVIQKLVEGFDAKSDEKKKLVAKLRQYLKQISSKNTYGKHLASVEKMIIVAENALIEAEKTS